MSTLPAIATLNQELVERAADPGEFVVAACERAKAWLAEVLADGSIEQIVEFKSQAEAIRVYTLQKNLGKDAELAAAEIVRRAERGIGLAVRKGQEAGEIAKRGDRDLGDDLTPPETFFPHGSKERHSSYAMADHEAEKFDAAIEEARGEGNLSRANVVRKVKGLAPPPPRSKFHRKRRHIDAGRVLNETISALEGLTIGLRLVDVESLPDETREEWGRQLATALRPLTSFQRKVTP